MRLSTGLVSSTISLSTIISLQALCQAPRRSDVYHLTVNLLDRYLSYEVVKSEEDFQAIAAGCTMISMKIRRARKECISYDQLRCHFGGNISERKIRVRLCMYMCV